MSLLRAQQKTAMAEALGDIYDALSRYAHAFEMLEGTKIGSQDSNARGDYWLDAAKGLCGLAANDVQLRRYVRDMAAANGFTLEECDSL